MATKRGKKSGPAKKATTPPARPAAKKAAGRPAPPPPARKAAAKAAPARPAAPARRAAAAPAAVSLLDRAERLRDDILRSKVTHPDPWNYTAKARGWARRAQALVDDLGRRGPSPQREQEVGALATEVAGDRDFRTARQLF